MWGMKKTVGCGWKGISEKINWGINTSCTYNINLAQKKFEKLDNYSELRLEVARMWNKKTVVVPIIIGALGSVPKDLQSYLKQLQSWTKLLGQPT